MAMGDPGAFLAACCADALVTAVAVTAGGTREPIDPVRFLGNRSSGKQGYAIAAAAAALGARVTLVSGPVNLPTPTGVDRIDIESADGVAAAVKRARPAERGLRHGARTSAARGWPPRNSMRA